MTEAFGAMDEALRLARLALESDDVPVSSRRTRRQMVRFVGRGRNEKRELTGDPNRACGGRCVARRGGGDGYVEPQRPHPGRHTRTLCYVRWRDSSIPASQKLSSVRGTTKRRPEASRMFCEHGRCPHELGEVVGGVRATNGVVNLRMYFVQLRIAPQNPKTPQVYVKKSIKIY